MSAKGFPPFAKFFAEVHGFPPFAWQSDLAARVLDGRWPTAIDVPTGLGKTAVVDIAVYALAHSLVAGDGSARTRAFVIVDRRIIVDAITEHAKAIAEALEEPGGRTACEAVAQALRLRAGDVIAPLEVVRMRGGVTWDWRWLRQPDQPAVVVGTVDQLGSRALFRGYGVGNALRPLDAALCGTDALIVLDEAHLAQPLQETLAAAAASEARAGSPVLPDRRLHVVAMSATVPSDQAEDVFGIDVAAHLKDDVARPRLTAHKLAQLVELTWLDAARRNPAKQRQEFAQAVAALARVRLQDRTVRSLAVVVNTVATARAVHDELRADPGFESVLFIGRSREVERARLLDGWLPRLDAERAREQEPGRCVMVATQTIEVGADLDFDAMVTEAAPIDSLVQRFGRVARRGMPEVTRSVVVYAGALHDENRTYGDAVRRTWSWLTSQRDVRVREAGRLRDVGGVLDGVDDGPDFGPLAMRELLSFAASPMTAPTARPPVVFESTLDSWARTSPVPLPDQPVAPYLHGLDRATPEVTVCWRAGLPQDLAAWTAHLDVAPPVADETVTVPIWEAARLLAAEGLSPELSDEGSALGEADEPVTSGEGVRAVVYAGRGEAPPLRSVRDLRPGDLVVLPADVGGHDEYGWTGMRGAPVIDVADVVHRTRRRLRLQRDVVEPFLDPGIAFDWTVLTRVEEAVESGRGLPQSVQAFLDELAAALRDSDRTLADELAERVHALRNDDFVVVPVADEGPPYLLLGGSVRGGRTEGAGDSDDLGSSATGGTVTLHDHVDAVGRRAEEIAVRLGLPELLCRTVRLAGEAHDLGKADPRFQAMLYGGDRHVAEAASEPLAKSGMDPQDRAAHRRAARASGWPAGMRHEAISGAVVRRLLEAGLLDEDLDADLLVHLVVTHHGFGRPLNRPILDREPQKMTTGLPGMGDTVTVQSDEWLVDWEGPARFERLCRTYGRWGLALLETVVRLADIGCSEEGT